MKKLIKKSLTMVLALLMCLNSSLASSGEIIKEDREEELTKLEKGLEDENKDKLGEEKQEIEEEGKEVEEKNEDKKEEQLGDGLEGAGEKEDEPSRVEIQLGEDRDIEEKQEIEIEEERGEKPSKLNDIDNKIFQPKYFKYIEREDEGGKIWVLTEFKYGIGDEENLYIPSEYRENNENIKIDIASNMLFPRFAGTNVKNLVIEAVNGRKVRIAEYYEDKDELYYNANGTQYDIRIHFLNKPTLERVDLRGLDTSNVTDIAGLFQNCVNLKEAILDDWDLSNIEEGNGIFLRCEKLEEVSLLGWDLSNAKYKSIFYGCENLKVIDLGQIEISKLSDMDWWFQDCKNLRKVNFGINWRGVNLTSLQQTFLDAENLIYLDINNLGSFEDGLSLSIAFNLERETPLLIATKDINIKNKLDDINNIHTIAKNRIPLEVGPLVNPGDGEFKDIDNERDKKSNRLIFNNEGKFYYSEDNVFEQVDNGDLYMTKDYYKNRLKELEGELTPPERKIFSHWEYEEDGQTHKYNSDDITRDVKVIGYDENTYELDPSKEAKRTYTAIYAEPITSHTVSFIVEGEETRVSVEDGEKIQQRDIPDTSRPGYTFLGWKTREDGSGEDFDLASPIKSDLTLYASYRRDRPGSDKPSKPDKEKPEEKPEKPEEEPDKPEEKPNRPNDNIVPQKPSTPEDKDKVDRYKGGDRSEREDLIGMVIEDQIDYELNKTDHLAYLKGYKDDTVRPEGNVTREEAAMVFYRLMEPEFRREVETEDQDFTDVEAGRWSEKAIATLAKAEMITGYKDGSFKPTKEITRAEVSSMIGKLTDTIILPTDFKDIVEHWAEDYINSVEREGWIKGYEDGSFKPNALIKRSEFVTIVNSILERQVKKENVLEGIKAFKDLGENKWYYEQVIEATNGHKYVIKDGEEVWTELDKREFE